MFDHHCFGLVFFIFFHFAIRFWLLSFGFFLRTFSTITSDGSQVCAGSRYRPSRLRSLIQVHGFGRGGKNVLVKGQSAGAFHNRWRGTYCHSRRCNYQSNKHTKSHQPTGFCGTRSRATSFAYRVKN